MPFSAENNENPAQPINCTSISLKGQWGWRELS